MKRFYRPWVFGIEFKTAEGALGLPPLLTFGFKASYRLLRLLESMVLCGRGIVHCFGCNPLRDYHPKDENHLFKIEQVVYDYEKSFRCGLAARKRRSHSAWINTTGVQWERLVDFTDKMWRYHIMGLNLVGWNVVLDSDNADELSAFYERLLGWTRYKGEEYTVLRNAEQKGFPTWITIQQVDEYVPPVWPVTLAEQQQMAHLDFHVENVEEGVKHALTCGATMSEVQFDDRWRVMLDPAGHPFCILPPIMPWL